MRITPNSPRLSFRRLQKGDEEFFFSAIDERLTKDWIDWEPFCDIDQAKQNIDRLIKTENHIEFLAFNIQSNQFIGSCSLSPNDYYKIEVGYWVKVEEQKKGYGYEMLQALLWWTQNLSQSSHIKQVIYSVTTGNKASEAIIRKLFELPYQATFHKKFVYKKRGMDREVNDYIIALDQYPLLPDWLI